MPDFSFLIRSHKTKKLERVLIKADLIDVRMDYAHNERHLMEVMKNNNAALQTLNAAKIGLIGFLILLPLGFTRELFGSGEVFSNMDLLCSSAIMESKITTTRFFNPLTITTLPAGAFIFSGLLLAIYNLIKSKALNN